MMLDYKKDAGTEVLAPHLETNSKFILKMYDKNLLQRNGDSRNCEIPIVGYLNMNASP
jgi:hypothetical protein